eukprot:symbB.v1.2.007064.t1/scaffold414.1/size398445/28
MPRVASRAANLRASGLAAAKRLRLGRAEEAPVKPPVPFLLRRLHEPVTSDLPPAPWRHASDWVDLELLRAGLPSDPRYRIPSRWGVDDELQPEPSVLWPNSALDDHRSRAFMLPKELQAGPKAGPAKDDGQQEEEETFNKELQKSKGQLKENKERLEALWNMSNSHGISWDELDVAFVAFAKEGKRRYAHWSTAKTSTADGRPKPNFAERGPKPKSPEKQKSQEDAPTPGNNKDTDPKSDLPTAALMKRYCEERARQFLMPFCPKDENGRSEKRKFLAPWAPGKLTSKLQQLVAARMIRRETNDRLYQLKPKVSGEIE